MDISKIDIDGCECHILSTLVNNPNWINPKIIQIELNHVIPPPIVYIDICADDVPGRNAVPYESNKDFWVVQSKPLTIF
jgi:hypothetical protein